MAVVVLVSMIVCLVAQVQAGWFSSSQDHNHVNFDKLEKWIAENKYDTDPASFKANVDQLSDLKVRYAADILLDIVEATECNELIIDHFKEMADAGFVLKRKPRVEKFMLAAFERLSGLCGEYIESKVAYLYERTLDSPVFNHFLRVVVMKPLGWKLPLFSDQGQARRPNEEFCWYIGSADGDSWNPKPEEWASYLRTLAGNDEQALVSARYEVLPSSRGKQHKILKNYQAYKYTLNRYLAPNCQSVVSAIGNTVEGLYGLLELQCSTNKRCYQQFILERSNNILLTLLFAYKICKPFYGRQFYYNSDIFDKYSEQESLGILRPCFDTC